MDEPLLPERLFLRPPWVWLPPLFRGDDAPAFGAVFLPDRFPWLLPGRRYAPRTISTVTFLGSTSRSPFPGFSMGGCSGGRGIPPLDSRHRFFLVAKIAFRGFPRVSPLTAPSFFSRTPSGYYFRIFDPLRNGRRDFLWGRSDGERIFDCPPPDREEGFSPGILSGGESGAMEKRGSAVEGSPDTGRRPILIHIRVVS